MRGESLPMEWIISILQPTYKNKGNLDSLIVTEE